MKQLNDCQKKNIPSLPCEILCIFLRLCCCSKFQTRVNLFPKQLTNQQVILLQLNINWVDLFAALAQAAIVVIACDVILFIYTDQMCIRHFI